MSPQRTRARSLRVAFGLAALAYLLIPPTLWQLGGVRWEPLPRWRMFTGHAVDLCEVRFTTADGAPIDRLEALGEASARTASPNTLRLMGFSRVYGQARSICHLDNGIDELHAHTRCAGRGGWRTVTEGRADLCVATPEEAAEGRQIRLPYARLTEGGRQAPDGDAEGAEDVEETDGSDE